MNEEFDDDYDDMDDMGTPPLSDRRRRSAPELPQFHWTLEKVGFLKIDFRHKMLDFDPQMPVTNRVLSDIRIRPQNCQLWLISSFRGHKIHIFGQK